MRARIFDRRKYANRRLFLSYSNSWLASFSLFVADAAGSGCAVSNSRHRRPGKQAAHVGRRGFHLRPRPLPGSFTRSTGLWKSHGGLESKAIPRDEPGPRRKANTVASNLRIDPPSDEA